MQCNWPGVWLFELDPTLSLSCEAKSCVWCKAKSEADFQVLSVHLCLRTAYTTPGLCLPVLWFMSTNQLIYYKLCMHLNCDIWKFACYLHDVWSHWSRSCHPETSKEGHGTGVTLGNIPHWVWDDCKEESWLHIILCSLSHIIDGKQLLCSHTLLSNHVSPLCNLAAQSCVVYYYLGQAQKQQQKLMQCHEVSITVILTAEHLTVFWITLQIINQIPPQGDMSVISNLISFIWRVLLHFYMNLW